MEECRGGGGGQQAAGPLEASWRLAGCLRALKGADYWQAERTEHPKCEQWLITITIITGLIESATVVKGLSRAFAVDWK